MAQKKVLVFGEILWDVYPSKKTIGGAPLNFAAHLARHGMSAYMLSAVGNDELGRLSLDWLGNQGVNTDLVTVSGKQTGVCNVTLDERSVPTYDLLYDVAWDDIKDINAAFSFDMLYFGTLALRGENNLLLLKRLIENNKFGNIFVDINIRKPYAYRENTLFAAQNATILKISDEELPTFLDHLGLCAAGDHKDTLQKISSEFENLKLIILTQGEEGAMAFCVAEERFVHVPSNKVQAVSTVGAGDSYSAAFVYKYLNSEGLESSMLYAAKVASFVVSKYDAVPEYSPSDFK